MNYLILGGNGYLGSKIIYHLLNRGDMVFCVRRSSSDLTRLKYVYNKISWVTNDIKSIERVLSGYNIDCIVNAACNYGRQTILYGDVLEANIEFPLKVLNAMTECGASKFLTIGTGLPDELNMYSFSKKMFSEFGRFYVEKHHINFYNLKLEMFYGPDEPIDRFIPSVILSLLKNKDVSASIGTQRRDIIFIDDIVKAIFLVLDSELKGYHEISVGTGIAPSISEILDYISEITKTKAIIHKGAYPMRVNEPDCIADIDFLSSLGEWNPIYWKDGLSYMIEEMRKRYINENFN